MDDIEGLPRGMNRNRYSLRSMIFSLASELMVQGRHRAQTVFCLIHNVFSGQELTSIRNEAARFFILFSHSFKSSREYELSREYIGVL